MNDLEPDLAESNPFWSLGIILLCAVMIPSRFLCLCPRPSNVHFLEIHIRALSAQVARFGLHLKQTLFSGHSTGDVYQNVLARLHQIKPLTMNVLQVGIANSRRRPPGHGRSWSRSRWT